jgi:uncharacterized protein YndB with AHSA1/START domain
MLIEFSFRFDQPVETLFPYLAEPSKWPEFVPNGVVERTRIGEGPVGPGTKWKAVDRVGPLRVEFTDELIELEPNRRVAWRHSAPWNASTVYDVVDDEGGSLVSVHFEGKLTGKLRWLDLVPDSLATRIFRGDFERLRALLDAKPTTGH